MTSCNQKQMILDYFSHNLEKGLKSMVQGVKDTKNMLTEKYPHVNTSEVEMIVSINRDGTINSTEVISTTMCHSFVCHKTPYNINNNGEDPIRVIIDSKTCEHCMQCNECT